MNFSEVYSILLIGAEIFIIRDSRITLLNE